MRRPLRLFNLLLGLAAALMVAALIRTWVAPIASPASSPAVTKPSHEAEALAYNPTTRPPLNEFAVLLDKNPFKQPPPGAARPFAVAPPTLPTLVGTILVDSERRAILSDKGKSSFYSVGEAVAGGVITEIKEDRITFKRGDTTQEIMLKAAIESVAAAQVQVGAPAAGLGALLAPSPGPSQSPAATPEVESPRVRPASPGEVADAQERLRRQREQGQQRRQQMRGE